MTIPISGALYGVMGHAQDKMKTPKITYPQQHTDLGLCETIHVKKLREESTGTSLEPRRLGTTGRDWSGDHRDEVALSVDTEHEPWPLSRRSPPQRAWGGVNPHSGPPSDGEEVRGREVPGEEVDNVVIEEGAQVMM
jgi:hypothetical protein